jgi:RHH-type proline utilization regulon transcriptional repressor/proline dehydrogenase/delta 1-pyrroline-5-carboxylate dehydrogenase
LVPELLSQFNFSEEQNKRIQERTRILIEKVRAGAQSQSIIDQMMRQFPLSTHEGVLLMCLAEALLRIPDRSTRNALLRDKLSQADFKKYLNNPSSWAMKLATRGFSLGADLLKENESSPFKRALGKTSLPVMEKFADQAMRLLAGKFVLGSTIEEALETSVKNMKRGYTYSFDMLGEAAFTEKDAALYYEEYFRAIQTMAKRSESRGELSGNSISVKLSALHPRYSFAQQERVMIELSEKLLKLCQAAFEANIALTVDAEESERLEISLKLIEQMALHPMLQGWHGLGLAVQAYQKRAVDVIDFLIDLAEKSQQRLNVRLVKGAYWDSEIKRCQELGLEDYPVFTRKETTDLSYLVCAQKLLARCDVIFPQFATHNALTILTIMEFAEDNHNTSYEFQKLHGMGDELYEHIIHPEDSQSLRCRIYAPVGSERELLPYLVRRLLENGANTSFVNHLMDKTHSIDDLIQLPQDKLERYLSMRHGKIPLPQDLYGKERKNSPGIDLVNPREIENLLEEIRSFTFWAAHPVIGGKRQEGPRYQIHNPARREETIGEVQEASPALAQEALVCATQAFESWNFTSAQHRAQCLRKTADLMIDHYHELIALCIREGGKTLTDAISEVREAIDFCRYYAERGEIDFGTPLSLPGATGETNEFLLQGRGVFICISPWNFPLAIFVGQIAAALMAGNCVIAKPARQTPLIAFRACQLFYEAGIPQTALQYLPGSGSQLSAALLKDERVAGVAFTGSIETAHIINRMLASRDGAIGSFIAETGGQNAMIVDSSALPEQVVTDVLSSAFQSAGQRCSALRLLLVQEEIASRVIDLLKGAMAELKIGDPFFLSTDVGPVIDEAAQKSLDTYRETMKSEGQLIYECPLDVNTQKGTFVPPSVFEISSFKSLTHEVFGPVLHVMRFKSSELEQVINQINHLKFGLTFGLHTRLDGRMEDIARHIGAGNVYINRNIIGAVVGTQPFGGQGLSGTGPKAGGPYYLHRFATEKTISINTTAQGGNTSLMTLSE